MSKRDSRVQISVRQNDTLLEFETFKKKFLLSNKHITKLNSTLSVRIEELNAQISTLYVENLRLRASEIALASQLKREREKCQRVMAEAESATFNLLKHFGGIRQSFNIRQNEPPSPDTDSMHPPRAKRPPPRSPTVPRLAQPPTVSVICEDPEPTSNSTDERSSSPKKHRNKNTPRTSLTSRLPLPAQVTIAPLPPKLDIPQYNLVADELVQRKKKPIRRQSGLLNVATSMPQQQLMPPRPASPAFGSPERRQAALAEEEDELAVMNGEMELELRQQHGELIVEPVPVKKVKKEKKLKVKDRDSDKGLESERECLRKARDKDFIEEDKLKDVTNVPSSRCVNPTPPADLDREDRLPPERYERGRDPTPIQTSSPLTSPEMIHEPTQLPTPLTSSAPTTPAPHSTILPTFNFDPSLSDAEPSALGNRERRTRKSVNYAEPKLNTKMRKPDVMPPIGSRHSMSAGVFISSTSTSISTTHSNSPSDEPRPPSRPKTPSSSADSSPVLSNHSQPRSSTDSDKDNSPPTSVPITSTSKRTLTSSGTTTKRRKFPKPAVSRIVSSEDEDEDDGAEADAESGDNFKTGWVNVEARNRRNGDVQGSGVGGVSAGSRVSSRSVRRSDEETHEGSRRHSYAV